MIIGLLCIFISVPTWALDGKVVLLKGDVSWINSPKGSVKLATGGTVEQGAQIKTGDKSFVKLVLSDQTNITVGPNGQAEITTQPGSTGGLINLVSGKIRASVTPGDKAGPPKLIIATKKVSMGVRGTDLRVDFNPTTEMSTLLTFEGNVQMGRIPEGASESAVADVFNGNNPTVMVGPGQFSNDSPTMSEVMQPVVINPAQMEQLKSNQSFDSSEGGAEEAKRFGSVLPPGVDASSFAADKKVLAEGLGVQNAPESPAAAVSATTDAGVMQGGFFSEQAGYIPPPEGSRIDENTGLPIPSSSTGGVDDAGNYLPPEGLKLMDNGQFVLAEANVDLKMEDVPQVIGAPPTTELVTEAAFVQAQEDAKVEAPAAGPENAGPEGAGAGVEGQPPTGPGGPMGAPPVGEPEGGPANDAAAPPPPEDMSDMADMADQLATDLADEIIQDTIDTNNDAANNAPVGNSGRSNVTISIESAP